MCECKNVLAGSYDNQVMITDIPDHMIKYRLSRQGNSNSTAICVDKCIEKEILALWSLGIVTTGCCCGHNYLPGYIGVSDECILVMKSMGYLVQPNDLYPDLEDGFKPKSVYGY